MKLNKKQAGLIAGVVCVILLIILLLTMCRSGPKETNLPSDTSVPIAETTEPATETTEAEEETPAATEETTEATEETTEATEETTKPITGGNTRPGGTGGPSIGGGSNNNTGNQEATTETIPAAGSEGSPYSEAITSLPESFKTVAIPVSGTIYHNVDIESASVLTIEDADAYVIYNDTKYEADENGIVSLALAAGEEDAPVSIQVGNKSTEEKAFSLAFGSPVGSSQNPDVLMDEETVENGKWSKTLDVSLAAGNEEGYHYQYTAAEAGTLSFDLAETADCDILITVGENTVKLSESTDGTVAVDLEKDDVAMVQIVAVPEEDGTYPAVEAAVNCSFTYPAGTINNPIPVDEVTSVTIGSLAPEAMIYYSAENIKGAKLLIQDANAFVLIEEVTHTATSNRVLVDITTADKVIFAVGNAAETSKDFVLQINHPEGSKLRPRTLNINIATGGTFEQEYYYAWTATGNGKLTVTVNTQVSENWSFRIINATTGEEKELHSNTDDPVVSSDSIGFSRGDVVQVVVKGTINFTAKPSKKDNTAVSDTVLLIGENVLKNISTATTTIYKFTPTEIGTYIFETDAGTLSYWGSSVEEMANTTVTETSQLTQATTAENETILIGVTGSGDCKLKIKKLVTVTYGADETPAAYSVTLNDDQQFVTMDLTQKHELQFHEESGFYHIAENGSVVLVDFTSDAFVNIAKLVENSELYHETTADDGTVTRETYNALLEKYIASAAVVKISETETRKVYPLTEDLMYILKNVGAQLGWYDSAASGYLFSSVSEPEVDSLWLFSCCNVQTTEQPVNTASAEQTETTPSTEETQPETQPETQATESEETT